jgi:hypothetical protein
MSGGQLSSIGYVLSVHVNCSLIKALGKYFSANDLLRKGSLPLRSIQPSGFEDWLRTNATKYDPVLKQSPTGDALRELKVSSSLKCPEQKCIHYIYGFNDPESLEDHKQQQHLNSKKFMEPQPSSASSYPPNQSETGHHIGRRSIPSLEPLSERSQPSTAAQYPSSASKDPLYDWESLANLSRQNTNQIPIDQPLPKAKTGCNNCKYAKPRYMKFS